MSLYEKILTNCFCKVYMHKFSLLLFSSTFKLQYWPKNWENFRKVSEKNDSMKILTLTNYPLQGSPVRTRGRLKRKEIPWGLIWRRNAGVTRPVPPSWVLTAFSSSRFRWHPITTSVLQTTRFDESYMKYVLATKKITFFRGYLS